MLSSSKTISPWAIGIVPEEQAQRNCNHHYDVTPIRSDKVDCKSNSALEIEVQWKSREKANRRVHFDPAMDWKSETLKAEHGNLRRLAEKEIKKRLDIVQRKGRTIDWSQHPHLLAELKLSKMDRQKETFLYICFCDVKLLVNQYNKDIRFSENCVIARMFDLLFQEAGIKTPSEGTRGQQLFCNSTCTHSGATGEENTDSSAWLWTCFLALQLEYRRLCENNSESNTIPNTAIYPYHFVSGLCRKVNQVLFYIHWLSPAFRCEEKESRQRQVYALIFGDSNLTPRLEEYLFEDSQSGQCGEENSLKDLRRQVHELFRSLLHTSLVTSSLQPDSSIVDTDLNTFFAALRETGPVAANDVPKGSCGWQCCCHRDYPRELLLPLFPYHSLTCDSKYRLFLISSMPAFRVFLAKRAAEAEGQIFVVKEQEQCCETIQCSELFVLQSPFHSLSFSGDSNESVGDSGALKQEPTNNAAVTGAHDANDADSCDCPFIAYHYDDYEVTQDICNVLF